MSEKQPIDSRVFEPKRVTPSTSDSAVRQTSAPYISHRESSHECTDACLPTSGDPDSFNPDTGGFDHLLIRSTRPTDE